MFWFRSRLPPGFPELSSPLLREFPVCHPLGEGGCIFSGITQGRNCKEQLSFEWLHAKCSSLLAEALFLVFADGRKETSAMDRKWLH